MAYGWWDAFGDIGAAIIKRNTTRGDMKRGEGLIADALEKNRMLNEANNQMTGVQDQLGYFNKGMDLNKRWESGLAKGLKDTDAEMQDIIKESTAWRNDANQKGYTVPGQDVSLANYQSWIDNKYSDLVKPIAEKHGKYLPDVSQHLPPNFANRDAGATERPDFNVNGSITGMMAAIKKAQAELNDPVNLQMALTKLNLSPEAMQKLAPAWEAYRKSNTDQQAIDLLATMMDPNATPDAKVAASVKYGQIYGNNSGLELQSKLAPKTSIAAEDTGSRINYVATQQPGALGVGGTSAKVIRSTQKEVSPTSEAQMNLQRSFHEDDKVLNWAKFNRDTNAINRTVTDEDGAVYGITGAGEMRKLGSISTFSKEDQSRVRSLQSRADNALKLYKAAVNQYDPEVVTPGMQQAMDDYNSAMNELDSIFNKGKNGQSGGQQQSGKSLTAQEKARLNQKYTDEQLRQAGYSW